MPRQVNKGPNGGGAYDNAQNSVADSGEPPPAQANTVTGQVMGYNRQESHSLPSESRQATEAEMRGGNR